MGLGQGQLLLPGGAIGAAVGGPEADRPGGGQQGYAGQGGPPGAGLPVGACVGSPGPGTGKGTGDDEEHRDHHQHRGCLIAAAVAVGARAHQGPGTPEPHRHAEAQQGTGPGGHREAANLGCPAGLELGPPASSCQQPGPDQAHEQGGTQGGGQPPGMGIELAGALQAGHPLEADAHRERTCHPAGRGSGERLLAPGGQHDGCLVAKADEEPCSGGVLPGPRQCHHPGRDQGQEQAGERLGAHRQQAHPSCHHLAEGVGGPPQQRPERGKKEPPGDVDQVVEHLHGSHRQQHDRGHEHGPQCRRRQVAPGHVEDQAGQRGQAHRPAHGYDRGGVRLRGEPGQLDGEAGEKLAVAVVRSTQAPPQRVLQRVRVEHRPVLGPYGAGGRYPGLARQGGGGDGGQGQGVAPGDRRPGPAGRAARGREQRLSEPSVLRPPRGPGGGARLLAQHRASWRAHRPQPQE